MAGAAEEPDNAPDYGMGALVTKTVPIFFTTTELTSNPSATGVQGLLRLIGGKCYGISDTPQGRSWPSAHLDLVAECTDEEKENDMTSPTAAFSWFGVKTSPLEPTRTT